MSENLPTGRRGQLLAIGLTVVGARRALGRRRQPPDVLV